MLTKNIYLKKLIILFYSLSITTAYGMEQNSNKRSTQLQQKARKQPSYYGDYHYCVLCKENFIHNDKITTIITCTESFHKDCFVNYYTINPEKPMDKCPTCNKSFDLIKSLQVSVFKQKKLMQNAVK